MSNITATPVRLFRERLNVPTGMWADILSKHQLCDDALGQSNTKIALDTFVAITDELCNRTPENLVAWRLGEEFELSYLSGLGESLIAAPTLRDALLAFEMGFCTFQSDTLARLTVKDSVATFEYRILDTAIWPRRSDAKLTLGLIYGLIKRYCGNDWQPINLTFEHAPGSEANKLMNHAQSTAQFEGSTNSISFPARLLSYKHPQISEDSYQIALSRLSAKVRDFQNARTTSQRIESKIMENLGAGAIDQTQIAVSLGMSRRTLRRRLEEEELSFKALVEACRKKSAYAALTRTQTPLCEIAFNLGYSDQTAFSRAFTRWFGLSPYAIRKAALNEPLDDKFNT